MPMNVPPPIAAWVQNMPQDYVGTFHAKIKPPLSPVGIWFRIPAWGQLCDGADKEWAVRDFLYNEFPFHGRGWTYIAWRCEPENPKLANLPLSGIVK